MNLIDEIYLAVTLAKLVLGIDENQALLSGNLLTTLEDAAGVVLHDGVVFSTNDALGDDLLLGDVHVVTLVSFGSRGDDRLWETLVLTHTVRQLHAAKLTASLLVLSPGTTGEDGADDHLHTEALALQTYGYHWVWGSQLPVRADVGCGIQKLGCNLVEHLSLERNTLRQYNVER